MRFILLLLLFSGSVFAQKNDFAQPVPATDLDLLPGFHAERLYQVPREEGSWVSMAFSPSGELIVSPEGGGLFRVNVYPLGSPKRKTRVTKLKTKLGTAHGLHFVGDALYAVSGGVTKLSDTNGDGEFDHQTKLLEIKGGGEHGPHAIVPDPRGKWLYVIAGNATALPKGFTRDRVSALRGASQHSPPGPQGWVLRMSLDGKQRELFALGLRNSFGLAVNSQGEVFTFDSDNEGFMGLPWYRPTNIYHIVSGADFGWRQSSKNLMRYHPDNLPPVLEVGPGSPTGMVFGEKSKFPERFRHALFVNDWSYGRIYAIHLTRKGAGFEATAEFFVSGRPLAVTDLRVGKDGALYFLTGGRGTQSSLYRLTYSGKASEKKHGVVEAHSAEPSRELQLRTQLESYHGRQDPRAIEIAWPHLKHDDRTIRFSARTAIEHQNLELWLARAFKETNATASIEAMIAVARQGRPENGSRVYQRLLSLPWDKLPLAQRLGVLRAFELSMTYLGQPEGKLRAQLLARFDPLYPGRDPLLNRELVKLLLALQAERVGERTIEVLRRTSTAMEQLHYLVQLNDANITFSKAQQSRLRGALDLETIRDTGAQPYKNVGTMIQSLLSGVGDESKDPVAPAKRVKQWKLSEVLELGSDLSSGDHEKGRAAFRKANCHNCHRIGTTGGVLGPNLTSLSSRFKLRDVIESIVDPDRVVADQYRTTIFRKTDGKEFTGQIVNLSKGVIQIRLDPLRPFPRVSFPESEIEEMRLSKTSLMPKGLLDTLTPEEVRDLLTYLLKRRPGR